MIEGKVLADEKKHHNFSPENLHGEIRLALGYKVEDVLKGSSIRDYDFEKRFDGLDGAIDIPGVDFYYDDPIYGFEVPNAMLVSIRSDRWSEDNRRYSTNEMEVRFIDIIKRPLYSLFDDAVEEVEKWYEHFMLAGFIPFKHKHDFDLEEVRSRFSEEIPRNDFPTFSIRSLMSGDSNKIIRLGVIRAKNKNKPDEYVYNINIVMKKPRK